MRGSLRRSGFVLLLLAAVGVAHGQTDAEKRARRRTPVVEVFERCRDAVVNISTTRVVQLRSPFRALDDIFDFGRPRTRNRRVESVGSGVVIHGDGYIVTNAHVVARASDVQIAFADNRELPAEVVAIDSEHDLAVLRIVTPGKLATVPLGRSDDLMIGETVIAIGNPLGLQHSVTAGIVSAVGRDLVFSADTVYSGLIQTDAPINPGNSGGPLLNINGELIGINSAIRGDAQNIGFAIPVDRLWELLPRMLDIEQRQRVRLGLEVSGPAAEVTRVAGGSPADRAGVRVGDHVSRIDGHRATSSIDYYVHLLRHKPGDRVKLQVRRGETTIAADIPLEAIPMPDGRQLAQRRLGLKLIEVPEDLLRKHRIPAYARLMIEEVRSNSFAERARLEKGDFIVALERVPVNTLDDVGLVLEQIEPGSSVTVSGLSWLTASPYRWTAEIPTTR